MAQYKFKINGGEYEVTINGIEGKVADVQVNGTQYKVEIEDAPKGAVAAAPAVNNVASPSPAAAPAPTAAPAASGAGEVVTSPLPGVIIEMSVSVGQAVKAGQKVAVLEAMKMENEIQAPKDGNITAVHVSKGDSILEGANIVTIA